MKEKYLNEAIGLLSNELNVKLSFNYYRQDVNNTIDAIILHEASAGTIKRLHDNGFSLYLTKHGLSISKF